MKAETTAKNKKIFLLGPRKLFPDEDCDFISTNITHGSLPHATPGSRSDLLKGIFRFLLFKKDYKFAVIRCLGPLSVGPTREKGLKLLSKKFMRLLFVQVAKQCRKRKIPVAIIDKTDFITIHPDDRIMLELSDLYFKRELAVNKINSFERIFRGVCIGQIEHHPFFQAAVKKLRPISLGIGDISVSPIQEKEYDFFYAGDPKLIEQRTQVKEALEKLKEEGFRVLVPSEFISRQEYEKALSKSWFCPSPMGCGWDCYRHYEIIAAGSIPILYQPSIIPYAPIGEFNNTGLTVNLEENLTEQLKSFLKLPEKERINMINAGISHIKNYHTNHSQGNYISKEMKKVS